MNFDDWKEAVDNSLKGTGRSFGVDDVDLGELSAAFAKGISPVLFARQARPMAPQLQPTMAVSALRPAFGSVVPPPSGWVVRLTALIFTILGWISWLMAVLSLLLFIIGVVIVGVASRADKDADGRAGWLALFLGTPAAVAYFFMLAAVGAANHYLAQRLLLAWHSWK